MSEAEEKGEIAHGGSIPHFLTIISASQRMTKLVYVRDARGFPSHVLAEVNDAINFTMSPERRVKYRQPRGMKLP